ncbi:hypothetical protein FQN55_007285 [Onygenales sp. PD_40]|nr:hypothetical protein FQN55_007285 [Onygenales sp. PD_40]
MFRAPAALAPKCFSPKFRYLLVLAIAIIAIVGLAHQFSLPLHYTFPQKTPGKHTFSTPHPINDLIWNAEEEFKQLLETQTHDVSTAAKQYRKRRGRHPPPGFDEWFKYAQENNAVIIEEFFDQIYHDLNPFWALEPAELRRRAASIEHRVIVRDRKATVVTAGKHLWVPHWLSLIESIQEFLPDVIVPLNAMDESRIIVPHETIEEYAAKERTTRKLPKAKEVIQEFTKIPETKTPELPFDPAYEGPNLGPYWKMASRGCAKDSPARTQDLPRIDFSNPPPQLNNYLNLSSYHGYVQNFTLSKSVCDRPELKIVHGNFIEPVSISTSQKLFPLFGGSKLSINNEILIPAAMYYAEGTIWSGDETHGGKWENKDDTFVWRGTATGGRNKRENWNGFHRHRFVSMLNATTVRLAESGDQQPQNFLLPDYETYHLSHTGKTGHIAPMIDAHADTGFTHLVCFPSHGPTCPYTDPFFSPTPAIPMDQQYKRKYLPDIDGNSFSGRYRGFLLSTSLPIKATLYNEWHDTRLVPWIHFVPMDSTYSDVYGIMEYFLGREEDPESGRDHVARKIALDGKAWAERVLRREDMRIYVYRLLLEYARLCDERRGEIGFVGDLKDGKKTG